jgi:hypothetical protein
MLQLCNKQAAAQFSAIPPELSRGRLIASVRQLHPRSATANRIPGQQSDFSHGRPRTRLFARQMSDFFHGARSVATLFAHYKRLSTSFRESDRMQFEQDAQD